ncbi:hypothetical protein HQ29_02855 [Porphyromonas canoris]|uniref:DUF3108 domain-containing protein n=1 Tax=Porphyromonas canoris TaxID=36875 RepID=UPI00051DFF0A|nr:DUF3108 domain-containing protein [Porphyromonas canoris]KGL53063.1 hypothetical protein HQ29_02855 [Porphyromonas canoris]
MTTKLSQRFILLFFLLFTSSFALAQGKKGAEYYGFYKGERLEYEVRFKWGIINGRAGLASVSTRELGGGKQWFRELHFQTTGMIYSVFPMKDTLSTLYNSNYQPLRWEKRVRENGYYLIDEIQYDYSPRFTSIRSKRYTLSEMKVDTLFSVPKERMALDMVAAFGFIRSEDIPLPDGVSGKFKGYNFYVPIGKDLVPCRVVVVSREVISMPWSPKVPAIKMVLSINDEAFTGKNDNVELWISEDKYRIPLMVKAKLKLGAAHCILQKHPHL